MRASKPHQRTRASLAAGVLELVAALLLVLLSHFEHRKTVRPSLLLGSYLTITVLLDAVRLRTFWLKFGTTEIVIIFTLYLGAKIGVLAAEAVKKRNSLIQDEKDASIEETSGLYNLGFFLWPLGLIKAGFKNTLLLDDLTTIDRALAPERAQQRFLALWNSNKCRLYRPSRSDYCLQR